MCADMIVPNAALIALARDLVRLLNEQYGAVISAADASTTEFTAAFDARENSPPPTAYGHVPPEAHAMCRRIAGIGGSEAVSGFLRMVLAATIADVEPRLSRHDLPEAIQRLYGGMLNRILGDVAAPKAGHFRLEHDLFIKDFAIARLKLVPGGAELLDCRGQLAGRLLHTGGVRQGLRLGFTLLRMGGRHPVIEAHWDHRLLREFSQAGYQRLYHNVARLMIARPKLLGLVGTAWWFDPALRDISPELGFLRDDPARGGALFLDTGNVSSSATIERALRFSPKRAALYREGRYAPRSWCMLWPRHRLLAWARENTADSCN